MRNLIDKEVMRKYPLTEKEKQGCKFEKQRMDELRKLYRERLLNDNTPIHTAISDTSAQV